MIDNSTLVLFGARGNLAKVKLIPGLFHLDKAGKLPKNMKILSVGRQEVDESEWHSNIKQMLDEKFKSYDENVYERFIKRNHYHANLPDDPEAFIKFAKRLGDKDVFPQNLAFFLSVRPSDFALIVKQLSEVDLLNESEYWRRVLIEKPFGTCLKSAIELQTSIEEHLKEDQIYRIDHYLGKFSLQNIMTTRFKNGVLEPLWSSEHIEQIQITNHETLGVGDRTVFYEATGALRDMIQSHLLQMLALVTMEKPNSMSPEDVRLEKIKLLESIEAIPLDEIENFAFRGQYAAGELNGETVKGYLEEVEKPDSVVETYAAIKLFINNSRWNKVPIYLRTAKRLYENSTSISIKFKDHENWLTINIQPNESTSFEITTLQPGLDMNEFRQTVLRGNNRIEGDETIDAYETLMLDLLSGDQSKFLHIDEVKAAWKLVDPIIDYWSKDKSKPTQYKPGEFDPEESKVIFEDEGQFWKK
jgi:glucose-6-phosphate 1-dehydrogenase